MTVINAVTNNTEFNINVNDINVNVILSATLGSNLSYIDEDTQLLLDGSAGNSYLKYNSSTNRVELYVDGVKQVEWG